MRFWFLSTIVFLILAPSVSFMPVRAFQHVPDNLGQKGEQKAIDRLNDSAYYYVYVNVDSGFFYARKALAYSKKTGYVLGEINAHLNLSRASYTKGEYDEVMTHSWKAKELSEEVDYQMGIGKSRNVIGLVFLAQDKVRDALLEFQRSKEINLKEKDTNAVVANLFNIGICYTEMNKPAEALAVVEECRQLSLESKNIRMYTMSINKLGDFAFREKEYVKALTYFRMVTDYKAYQNEWENAFAYTGMALAHHALGNYSMAIEEGKKGLVFAEKVKANWDIERAHEALHKSYAAIGMHKEAYVHLEQNKLYHEKLYSEKKDKEINRLHLKQKEIENEELSHQILIKKQREELNRMIIAVVGSLALSLVLILALIYRNQLKVKRLNRDLIQRNEDIALQKDQILTQNKSLENLNHSKDQLFSVIGHDLRSPIASLIQTLELVRSEDLTLEEARMILDGFLEKVTATATMLDNLLLWASNQKGAVKTEKKVLSLPQLVDQLLSVLRFQAVEKEIELHQEIHNDAFVFADLQHVRIILQNLISNAIKFTDRGGLVSLKYEITAERVRLHVRDSGVGIPAEKRERLFKAVGKDISTYGTKNEKGIGIGLMLAKKYADENGASIDIISHEIGTTFLVSFDRARF